ncbi:MAG: hypothetical protein H6Q34_559, partial [Deltaproteobacteria bacterium]|nr:hypothetical protein [Deltaproteobacteria bacterium]
IGETETLEQGRRARLADDTAEDFT